ncbi:YdbL family protein [Azospirillum sp. RWY-5-1]|uniref:YdbL family protein n=1 Tax=Azospirillum oleiclasticum TaxID=2735135 RepID=A0ABX2T836_9PROT|nr:DUF1318 domain-containing protein [Azospirillum oleiclasticum]NYZ12163.1 YdbL family protein [Azospirillum oleiclasticum]NYZ19323.1 YdbL family protein [Azospirillum oleiclasticum]
MNRREFLTATAALLTVAALPTLPALAQDELANAKQAGHVGERPDGLVGAVPGAPASAAALAERVNAARLARYGEMAKANGTSLQAVQAIAGKELIGRTPAGQYVFANGAWVRK